MTKLVSVNKKLIDTEHKFISPAWNRIPYSVEEIINIGFSRLSILESISRRLYHEFSP